MSSPRKSPTHRLRWYFVRVRTNAAGNTSHAPFHVTCGGNPDPIPLRNGTKPDEWELLFCTRAPKADIRVHPPEGWDEPEPQVRVRRVAAPLALMHMFRSISSRDRQKGNDPLRIYRKSWARCRHFGWFGFLERLVREYHPWAERWMKQREMAGGNPYTDWMEQIEKPRFSDADAIRAGVDALEHKPRFSVIMPTYNTPARYLRLAIQSVQRQSYPYWELCIADDASTKPHVRQTLTEFAARDDRIKVTFREQNGNISAASNSALELATGDYVALLDHDDELSPHALYFMAGAINDNPDATIIYSDEDKINEEGQRFSPHFKGDWNPDLLLSQNYISHLGVYKRDLLTTIGGFRQGVEGSQDYDLLLRCLPHTKAHQIVHVPWVLYHWRALSGSTALRADQKDHTTAAGLKALRDYFFEIGHPEIEVDRGMLPNTYRVRYPIPDPAPPVTLLIPTRDHKAVLETCIQSIIDKTDYPNYEILILNNQSGESETLRYFEKLTSTYPYIRVLTYDHPFNFSAINNFGVAHASGDIIGLINNDVEVINTDWLSELVSHACRSEIGCVGAKLYYPDDTIQHAGVILGIGGVAGHAHKYFPKDDGGYFARLHVTQNYSAVTGACLVLRKSVYEEVGGLDERNLAVAFNDIDLCLKVREAGYSNLWTPHALLYHHESKSRGAEDTEEKRKRFKREVLHMQKTWGETLRTDAYYSPHLSLTHEDFSIGTTTA